MKNSIRKRQYVIVMAAACVCMALGPLGAPVQAEEGSRNENQKADYNSESLEGFDYLLDIPVDEQGKIELNAELDQTKPEAGKKLLYRITAENTGSVLLKNLYVQNSFSSVGLIGSWETTEEIETLGNAAVLNELQAGEKCILFLSVQLPDKQKDSVELTLTAAAEYDTQDGSMPVMDTFKLTTELTSGKTKAGNDDAEKIASAEEQETEQEKESLDSSEEETDEKENDEKETLSPSEALTENHDEEGNSTEKEKNKISLAMICGIFLIAAGIGILSALIWLIKKNRSTH